MRVRLYVEAVAIAPEGDRPFVREPLTVAKKGERWAKLAARAVADPEPRSRNVIPGSHAM